MQSVYKILIEYENDKEKFDLEPQLDKRIDILIAEMFAVNPRNKITIIKDIIESN